MSDEVVLPDPTPSRRPPPMPAKFRPQEWWVGVAGEATGPFGRDHLEREVRGGAITAETPVANTGDDTWVTAGEDPVLGPLLAARAAPTERSRELSAPRRSDYSHFYASTTPSVPEPVSAPSAPDKFDFSGFYSSPSPLGTPPARPAPSISAERGATVVNVVNQIESPRPPPIVGDAADKSPGLAAVLSLLIVGLGQLYNGDFGKGVGMFILSMLLWTFFLGWLVNIWSIIDAYGSAKTKRDNFNMLRSYAYR